MNNFFNKNKSALIILTIGIIFMGLGVFRGEVKVVFVKAIAICLECIGIG